jgi:hypothetical protein
MKTSQDYIVNVYTIYTILSIVLIGWLAATLFSNGKHFLEVVFHDNHVLAKAVNRLLVTGFIMFSLGFASLTVTGGDAQSVGAAFELSTQKFGILLLVLAVVHFFNMLVLNNMRKTAEQKQLSEKRVQSKDNYDETLKKYNELLSAQTTQGPAAPFAE